MGRGRRSVARAWIAGLARDRCIDHSAHDLGEPERVDDDDRRQGLGPDPRQGRAAIGEARRLRVKLHPIAGWWSEPCAGASRKLRETMADRPILLCGLENDHEHVLRTDTGALTEQFRDAPEER